MRCIFVSFLLAIAFLASGQSKKPAFRALAFFTARNDLAHISFVHEANNWFREAAVAHHFEYDSTQDWSRLDDRTLSGYDLVIFLDTRPDSPAQRAAFERYMEGGGGWMGFHFSAFALTPSTYPQNWSWYHDHFLGSGEYKGNTWRPTTALLRVEDRHHPITRNLPDTLRAAPNEWYSWKNDLRANTRIRILLSIDTASFPLGTGPKPYEIWHSGYYPVVWTNTQYRMVYFNMGHNDMDYEGGTNRTLSSTFGSPLQNQLITNALLWLGTRKKNL